MQHGNIRQHGDFHQLHGVRRSILGAIGGEGRNVERHAHHAPHCAGTDLLAVAIYGIELQDLAARRDAGALALGQNLVATVVTGHSKREHGLVQSYGILEGATRSSRSVETAIGQSRREFSNIGTRRNLVFELIAFAATLAATAFGFVTARRFVRERLKFVDAAQTWRAPLIAGLVAWAVATPVVWLLPLIGGATALLFGVSVALGARAGARDIRIERRLTPGQI